MRRQHKILIVLLVLFAHFGPTRGQGLSPELKIKIEQARTARILFYNCENLFDYLDDSLKNDEEFLPEGDRHWTKYKYFDKLKHISKVITAVGGWSPPEIVGLCEIENYKTLYDLTHNTPLYLKEYKIIHKESPDNRGIDVALLYQEKSYTPLQNNFIEVNFPDNPEKKTRDILYSKGLIGASDTIHIFINHWPSRWGGEFETEEFRFTAANTLKKHTDSVLNNNPNASIVIMGDFNDEPTNRSLIEFLQAQITISEPKNNGLINLSAVKESYSTKGSHKYQGTWTTLDQCIVSSAMLNTNGKLHINPEDLTIFDAPFLLEKDDAYLGFKPYRTFIGYSYNGGYSDHLPIFIDLKSRN